MGKPKGTKDKASHDNGKGPMPFTTCPGNCELLRTGCFGAFQLVNGSCAPEGCLRQCKKFIHRKGRQCMHYAMTDEKYCYSHRVYNRKKQQRNKIARQKWLRDVPKFYSKVLGDTLKARLEELVESPPHEQLSAWEELAFVREHTKNVVQMYSALVEDHQKEDTKVTVNMLVETSSLMKDACIDVIEQCNKVQQLENGARDKISVGHLSLVIAQIVRCIYTGCGDDHEDIARAIERLISEEVRLPKAAPDEVKGTTINVINTVNNLGLSDASALQIAQSLGTETLLIGGAEVSVADLAREPAYPGAIREAPGI